MAGKKPHLFDTIPGGLTASTQLYTQRRSNAEAPANYRFTVQEVVDYLGAQGLLLSSVPGPYVSDAAAGTAGVPIGGFYEISISNIYGIPTGNGGILKRRVE